MLCAVLSFLQFYNNEFVENRALGGCEAVVTFLLFFAEVTEIYFYAAFMFYIYDLNKKDHHLNDSHTITRKKTPNFQQSESILLNEMWAQNKAHTRTSVEQATKYHITSSNNINTERKYRL